LSSLKIIKIANINFVENNQTFTTDSLNLYQNVDFLDCNIKITQNMLQSFMVELEGTNTSGNIGVAGSMTLTHKNIFKNAEVFDLHFKGAVERQGTFAKNTETQNLNTGFFNSKEFGVDVSFRFPSMMAPAKMKNLIKKFNPQTSISANYNYLNRPDYTRTIAGVNYGYTWNSNQNISHSFKPAVLDLVKLKDPTPEFLAYINKLRLTESYEDHFILGTSYSIIINNQLSKTGKNFTYLRINGKSAGNLLSGIMSLTKIDKQDESYKIAGNVFAQFIKADFDFRYYRKLSRAKDKIVLRGFVGAALPYGNIKVVPFGEKYFSGGANGVRAWQVRALGPGTYSLPLNTDIFPNQTSDIKLEANFEYRMQLFWMIEGAFFVDAGNIWAINNNDDRPGALFEFNKFYKEIAVGTGFGFRFDFDFFIVRFDFGLKLKDPALPEGVRWIPFNRSFNSNDWTFNIGIGYPF
jgi:outer membrane protein assembly factor BamA